jgi:hypothetical protein
MQREGTMFALLLSAHTMAEQADASTHIPHGPTLGKSR